MEEAKKIYLAGGPEKYTGTTAESGGDVGKLIGLIARIHLYVTNVKGERAFPDVEPS